MENDFKCLSYTFREGQVQDIPSVGREIKKFIDRKNIESHVFIQTCNRAEAYFFSNSLENSIPDKAILREGKEALNHLLEVTAGVDSLIVGETEILSQVREAFKNSIRKNQIDPKLKGVFDWALEFGKKVRRKTEISTGKVSVASIGLDHAQDILKEFTGKKAIIIGAGKIGTTAARFLKDAGIGSIFVANRTYEKAVELSKEVGGESYRLSRFPELLPKVEIIICATSAPHYILTEDKIPELSEKKVLLDLSVPTNVHPKVRENKMIEYVSYEELSKKARENLINRSGEVEKIRKMAREEVENFQEEDPYEDLYKEVEVIRREQVAKAEKELEKRTEAEVLQDFSLSLAEKIISIIKKEMGKRKENSKLNE